MASLPTSARPLLFDSQAGKASMYYNDNYKRWVCDVLKPHAERKTFKTRTKAEQFAHTACSSSSSSSSGDSTHKEPPTRWGSIREAMRRRTFLVSSSSQSGSSSGSSSTASNASNQDSS